MRDHRLARWALIASILAYLLLIAAVPLRLIEPNAIVAIGSVAGAAIVICAGAWLGFQLLGRFRGRG